MARNERGENPGDSQPQQERGDELGDARRGQSAANRTAAPSAGCEEDDVDIAMYIVPARSTRGRGGGKRREASGGLDLARGGRRRRRGYGGSGSRPLRRSSRRCPPGQRSGIVLPFCIKALVFLRNRKKVPRCVNEWTAGSICGFGRGLSAKASSTRSGSRRIDDGRPGSQAL